MSDSNVPAEADPLTHRSHPELLHPLPDNGPDGEDSTVTLLKRSTSEQNPAGDEQYDQKLSVDKTQESTEMKSDGSTTHRAEIESQPIQQSSGSNIENSKTACNQSSADDRINEEKSSIVDGFMFNRNRPADPDLPKDTVTVLHYPFPPAAIPVDDDENAYRAALAAAKVYLVGSAHFSRESQQDVFRTIESTQPDAVMVELCASRISILSMNEETLLEENRNLNMEKILSTLRQCGFVQGILHVLLLSMSAHITRTLGVAPGGEFRAAHQGATKVKMCKVILGDRPIQVTVQRALNSLNFYQKLRFFYHIVMSHYNTITLEDVERCKKSDMLEELLKELAGEFPLMKEIFVEERDMYMTNTLHTLLRRSTLDKRIAWIKTNVPWQPVTVVAVVGIGHVPGIVANWNKQMNVTRLLTIPGPTKTQKFIRFGFRIVLYGAAAYMVYRVGDKLFMKVQSMVKS